MRNNQTGTRDDHLMDDETFKAFTGKMWMELELHRLDKNPIKNWEPHEVWILCVDELKKRLELIETRDPEEIAKQSVHIANYMYFLNQKMNQLTERRNEE